MFAIENVKKLKEDLDNEKTFIYRVEGKDEDEWQEREFYKSKWGYYTFINRKPSNHNDIEEKWISNRNWDTFIDDVNNILVNGIKEFKNKAILEEEDPFIISELIKTGSLKITKTFLVIYTYSKGSESGTGRIFFNEDSKITRRCIERWEKDIKKLNNFDGVFITSFQELEEE